MGQHRLWVKSTVFRPWQSLPIYPAKRTSPGTVGMSQRCQQRTRGGRTCHGAVFAGASYLGGLAGAWFAGGSAGVTKGTKLTDSPYGLQAPPTAS